MTTDATQGQMQDRREHDEALRRLGVQPGEMPRGSNEAITEDSIERIRNQWREEMRKWNA